MMTKIAYLTVDDFPSADWQRRIDYLQAKSIPAVLFCIGSALETHPEAALYAIARGYLIGNHSYSHPHFSQIELGACREEIRRTDAIIEALYQQAAITRPAKVFRFPYLDKGGLKDAWDLDAPYDGEGLARKNAIQAALRDLGYTCPPFEGITYARYALSRADVDWFITYDCMDWAVFEPEPLFGIDSLEKVLARMDEDVPDQGRGLNFAGSEEIVLVHDHIVLVNEHHETTDMFEVIIEGLLAKGLQFRAAV
jgi:peptidoglycan/xylan/chitin deacetylase (PgdA/CDA1 family)